MAGCRRMCVPFAVCEGEEKEPGRSSAGGGEDDTDDSAVSEIGPPLPFHMLRRASSTVLLLISRGGSGRRRRRRRGAAATEVSSSCARSRRRSAPFFGLDEMLRARRETKQTRAGDVLLVAMGDISGTPLAKDEAEAALLRIEGEGAEVR